MTRRSQPPYPPELRERAVRMVAEVRADYESPWAAMNAVAEKLGVGTGETVRKWVRQAEIDGGVRPGTTSEESEELKLAFTIPLLVVLGLGAALLYGSGEQQAFAAVSVVWFLLIAGTVGAFRVPPGKGSTDVLPRLTLIPGVVWRLVWVVVAIVALIIGAQLLLRPGYGIG